MKQELLKGLSDEQVAKARACKSHEELLKLAEEEDVKLTDEQLEVVSGGGACSGEDKDDKKDKGPTNNPF